MWTTGETGAILCAARRYVICKSDEGVTVGLQFDGGHYAEVCSKEGDLDAAIREAFARVRQREQPDAVHPGQRPTGPDARVRRP